MQPFLNVADINHLTSYEFETECRRFSSFARLDGNEGIVRVLTRYKMFVDVTDVSLVPHLIMDGFWETPVTQCLARLIKEGDVTVDVGAHLGYFSILMSALAGASGRVLAVEPNPVIAAVLRRTAGINHPGFQVWEGALSNQTRELDFHVPKLKTGDSSLLVRVGSAADGFAHLKVLATTLDQLVSNLELERVDVIKMDAEGAEPQIFEGMTEVLRRNQGLKIVMEYSPHLYGDISRFNSFLLETFDIYRILAGFMLEKVSPEELIGWSSLKSHMDFLLVKKGAGPPY